MSAFPKTIVPTTIPALTLWLDADDASTITTVTGVSSWRDKSGNGFNPIQATTTKQPAYTANLQGGKAGVVGDGVDDFMQTSSNSVLMDPELGYMSIFVVSRCLTSTGYFVGKGSLNTTSGAAGWALSTSTTNIKQRAGTSTPTNIGDSSTIAGETTASIKEWYFTGSTLDYLKNGASNGSQKSYSASVTTARTLWLFARDTNDNYSNMYLHEVLIYKGSLSTSDRAKIRQYLGMKWGIATI